MFRNRNLSSSLARWYKGKHLSHLFLTKHISSSLDSFIQKKKKTTTSRSELLNSLLMEVFFFLVSGSVCLCGAAGHGVGRDFLGADHRLLPVQLQLVAWALASQLPGERLDALGRHHQGVDTGQWLLWKLEDELKLCHTGVRLAVWSQVCRKEESSLPSVWTVPYLPRSRSHLVWILFTHLYHFYTEKKTGNNPTCIIYWDLPLQRGWHIFLSSLWNLTYGSLRSLNVERLQQHNYFKKYAAGQEVQTGRLVRRVRASCNKLFPVQAAFTSGAFHSVNSEAFFFLILLNVFRQETGSLAHRHWEVQTFQLLLYEKYNNLFCWDARRVCAFVLGFTRLWLVRQHHVFIVCLGNTIG